MPPIQGETGIEKAERLRKASNLLREKARLARVCGVLKAKAAVCAKIEELLIQEGELEADLMNSPRTVVEKKPDAAETIMMIEDKTLVNPDIDQSMFANFKMEAHLPAPDGQISSKVFG